MPRSKFLSLPSLCISLVFCVPEIAADDGLILSRFRVGQTVTFGKAKSGGFDVTILPAADPAERKRDASMVCKVGNDFVMVRAADGSTKMISAHAIDVVNDSRNDQGDGPQGFTGTWQVGDGVELNVVVDGDQVSARYPKLDGTLEGRVFDLADGRQVLTGQWETFAGSGTITLVLDPSGSTFRGGWHNLNPNPEYAHLTVGTWTGHRVSEPTPARHSGRQAGPRLSAEKRQESIERQ